MSRFEYPVRLTRAKEGGFVVTCRDLPEVITQGDSREDASAQAIDALDEAFAARMKAGEDFPLPSVARHGEVLAAPPAESVAKAALYVAMREANVSKVEMAKRLGVDEKEVRRLLDPHHPSKLPRIAQAIELLGKRLVIELRAV